MTALTLVAAIIAVVALVLAIGGGRDIVLLWDFVGKTGALLGREIDELRDRIEDLEARLQQLDEHRAKGDLRASTEVHDVG